MSHSAQEGLIEKCAKWDHILKLDLIKFKWCGAPPFCWKPLTYRKKAHKRLNMAAVCLAPKITVFTVQFTCLSSLLSSDRLGVSECCPPRISVKPAAKPQTWGVMLSSTHTGPGLGTWFCTWPSDIKTEESNVKDPRRWEKVCASDSVYCCTVLINVQRIVNG